MFASLQSSTYGHQRQSVSHKRTKAASFRHQISQDSFGCIFTAPIINRTALRHLNHRSGIHFTMTSAPPPSHHNPPPKSARQPQPANKATTQTPSSTSSSTHSATHASSTSAPRYRPASATSSRHCPAPTRPHLRSRFHSQATPSDAWARHGRDTYRRCERRSH